MKLPDYPIEGEPVRAVWGRSIVDYLRSITPRSSQDIRLTMSPAGAAFELVKKPRAERNWADFPGLFDLYDIGEDLFKIRGPAERTWATWIAMERIPIGVGSGVTWSDDGYWRPTTAVSADTYVYLLVNPMHENLPNDRIDLCMSTTEPDNSLSQVSPLWFIPWDAENSRIDAAGIQNARHAKIYPRCWPGLLHIRTSGAEYDIPEDGGLDIAFDAAIRVDAPPWAYASPNVTLSSGVKDVIMSGMLTVRLDFSRDGTKYVSAFVSADVLLNGSTIGGGHWRLRSPVEMNDGALVTATVQCYADIEDGDVVKCHLDATYNGGPSFCAKLTYAHLTLVAHRFGDDSCV